MLFSRFLHRIFSFFAMVLDETLFFDYNILVY